MLSHSAAYSTFNFLCLLIQGRILDEYLYALLLFEGFPLHIWRTGVDNYQNIFSVSIWNCILPKFRNLTTHAIFEKFEKSQKFLYMNIYSLQSILQVSDVPHQIWLPASFMCKKLTAVILPFWWYEQYVNWFHFRYSTNSIVFCYDTTTRMYKF